MGPDRGVVTRMVDGPGVDVILPMYNSGETIEETIRSVQAQTYTHWELWVADDASTDDSCAKVEALAQRDERIHLLRAEENFGGPARPRNRAMDAGSHPYLAFVDADDLWVPHKLEVQLRKLEQDKNLLGICTNVRHFPKGFGNSLWLIRDRLLDRKALLETPLSWRKRSWVVNSSVMVRREVIAEVGYLDEDPDLISSEDYDYWVRILCHKDRSMLLLKEDLVHYRIHTGSITGLSRRSDELYLRLDKIFAKLKGEDVPRLRQRVARLAEIQGLKMEFYRGESGWLKLLGSPLGWFEKVEIAMGYLLKRMGLT